MPDLVFEEIAVFRLSDGSVEEIHTSNYDLHNYENAILIERYFFAKEVSEALTTVN